MREKAVAARDCKRNKVLPRHCGASLTVRDLTTRIAPECWGSATGRPRTGPVRITRDGIGTAAKPGDRRSLQARAIFQAPGQPSTPAREGAEEKMKTRLLLFLVLPAVLLGISFSMQLKITLRMRIYLERFWIRAVLACLTST